MSAVWSAGDKTLAPALSSTSLAETPVTIPNTILTSGEITRPFGRGNYRIVQRFHLGHEADLDVATAQLEAAAASVAAVLTDPPPTVFVEEIGDDAVLVRVHYWIDDPTRRDVIAVRSRLTRAAKERFEAANVAYTLPPRSAPGETTLERASSRNQRRPLSGHSRSGDGRQKRRLRA
jgi:small-conductance mechanosensitive channel